MPPPPIANRFSSSSLSLTLNLAPSTLLKYESIFLEKLQAKPGNFAMNVTKLFQVYDADKSGTLSLSKFEQCLSREMNGVPAEHIVAFSKVYDSGGSGDVILKELIERLTSSDAGVSLPPPPPHRENVPPPPPPPTKEEEDQHPSVIPMVGDLKTRLAKFRQGVKGLVTTLAIQKKKKLPSTRRLASGVDSELIAEIARDILTGVFEKFNPSGTTLTLGNWSLAFDYITRGPTQPSLHPSDLASLHSSSSPPGDYSSFVLDLYPLSPSVDDLVAANKLYGNTESVYKNRVDRAASGAPPNGIGPFDKDGEGEFLGFPFFTFGFEAYIGLRLRLRLSLRQGARRSGQRSGH